MLFFRLISYFCQLLCFGVEHEAEPCRVYSFLLVLLAHSQMIQKLYEQM